MESKSKAAAGRASPSTKNSRKDQKRGSGKTSMSGAAGTFLRKAANKLSATSKKKGQPNDGGTSTVNTKSKGSKVSAKSSKKSATGTRRRRRQAHNAAPTNAPDDYFRKVQPRNTPDDYFRNEQAEPEEPQAFFERTVATGCNELIEEYNRLRDFIPDDFTYGAFKQNPDKNRYKDVVCNEKTRVILKTEPPFTSDYIHANFVSTDSTPNKFICTQAPSAVTAVDFWRLVWQEQVPHVFMLCCVVEAGKPKCHQYWPMLAGDQMTISPFTIINKGLLPRIDETKPDEEKSKENVVSMRLTLTKADSPEERQINHYQWTSWPDKGVPADLRMAAYLLDAVNGSQHVVIHCSAGIGRTGTLAALDNCIERLEKKVKLDVPDVIKQVRTARMYSVQTKMQYVFLHMVLLERCRLKGWVKPGAAQQPSSKYDEMAADYAELVAKEQGARPETQPTTPTTTTDPGEEGAPFAVGNNVNAPFATPPIDTPQVQNNIGRSGITIPPPGQSIPIPNAPYLFPLMTL